MSLKNKASLVLLTLVMAAAAVGCSHTGVTAVNENTVVITKHTFFFFNSVYVCKVSDSGLTSCADNVSP